MWLHLSSGVPWSFKSKNQTKKSGFAWTTRMLTTVSCKRSSSCRQMMTIPQRWEDRQSSAHSAAQWTYGSSRCIPKTKTWSASLLHSVGTWWTWFLSVSNRARKSFGALLQKYWKDCLKSSLKLTTCWFTLLPTSSTTDVKIKSWTAS